MKPLEDEEHLVALKIERKKYKKIVKTAKMGKWRLFSNHVLQVAVTGGSLFSMGYEGINKLPHFWAWPVVFVWGSIFVMIIRSMRSSRTEKALRLLGVIKEKEHVDRKLLNAHIATYTSKIHEIDQAIKQQ